MDITRQFVQIKRMHRLTQLQHDIISYVHHRMNTAHTTATQAFDHPQGCLGRGIDTLDHTSGIVRAILRHLQYHLAAGFTLDDDGFDDGLTQPRLGQGRQFARDTGDAEAVATVGRQIDFQLLIVERQQYGQRSAWLGVLLQYK